MIQLLLALFSVAAFSQTIDSGGGTKCVDCTFPANECVVFANTQVPAMMGGSGPDGVPFGFDDQGKINIYDQDKIVKRNLKDGAETITYKVKVPKTSMYFMPFKQPFEWETIEKTITVKRNADGKLASVTALDPYRLPKLTKPSKKSKELGWSLGETFQVKSMTGEFTYDGDKCSLNQSFAVEKKDKAFSKEEKKIYFDKKLCDRIMPSLSDMGREDLEKCNIMLTGVEVAYDERSAEVAKEGKSFKNSNPYFNKNVKDGASAFNLIGVINGCLMAKDIMEYGMGMGVGVGGYGGGMYGKPMGEVPGKATGSTTDR